MKNDALFYLLYSFIRYGISSTVLTLSLGLTISCNSYKGPEAIFPLVLSFLTLEIIYHLGIRTDFILKAIDLLIYILLFIN